MPPKKRASPTKGGGGSPAKGSRKESPSSSQGALVPKEGPSTGRGRGQGKNIAQVDEVVASEARSRARSEFAGVEGAPGQPALMDVADKPRAVEGGRPSSRSGSGTGSEGSSSPSSADKTIRGRGGFKSTELHTIPSNVTSLKATKPDGQQIRVLCNFIKINPMKGKLIHQYRVDFQPAVESVILRKRYFREHALGLFTLKVIYDGVSDARSCSKLQETKTEVGFQDAEKKPAKLIIKHVGTVSNQFELIRVYNMQMKSFLRAMGYFLVGVGAYVHPDHSTQIGVNSGIRAVRGYKTAANVFTDNNILMNLESCHKLMQERNVLQYMVQIKQHVQTGLIDAIKNNLRGKLVITNYNKVIYKIEEVNFNMNPLTTFHDSRNNRDITYKEYYETRYQKRLTDMKQPLLLAIRNNNRTRGNEDAETNDIYLVPELCNIAGLTDQQRADTRLRMDLVRASQISPKDRVEHLKNFLQKLNNTEEVKSSLSAWGYEFGKEPLNIPARILPTEKIGIGRAVLGPSANWPPVNSKDGGFDQLVMREKCAMIPPLPKLKIIIGQKDFNCQAAVLNKIRGGFEKVGLNAAAPEVIRMDGPDTAQNFAQNIKRLPPDTTAALVILPNQNKERYDAIKKAATVERGLITQVVTTRLMMDDRKASGAATKIGVQVVAKLGGEPWHIHLPLADAMICGYDTYHDTAQRGRSFGAFIASMNPKYTQWWSKADAHDRLDELSTHMTENLKLALAKYKSINHKHPDRLIMYRDGVGDGQLEHVVLTELKQLQEAIEKSGSKIRLTVIIVNKRIGARFYWKNADDIFNPAPGTVIDDVVTRKERYDFYLISQSTRQGTVAPTYYNIIHDESGLDAGRHQALAFKLCFAYYNWTGTVRVPAPCQYAHKLALLCGEHLHFVPNATLDDRLHFL